MEDYSKYITDVDVPDWDEFFLFMTFWASVKSKDAQTKCGAIVTQGKDLLTMGYNSFPRDMIDENMPNLRPAKYPYIKHAEHNAVINCARMGKSTLNSTFYVTGRPCHQCLGDIINCGAMRLVYGTNLNAPVMADEEDRKKYDFILQNYSGPFSIKEMELDINKMMLYLPTPQ